MHITIEKYYRTSIWLVIVSSIVISWISNVYSLESKIIIPILFILSLYSSFRTINIWLSLVKYLLAFSGISWSTWQMVVDKDFVFLGDIFTIVLLLITPKMKTIAYYNLAIAISLIISFGGILLEPGVSGYLLFILYLILASVSLNAGNLYTSSSTYLEKKLPLTSKYFYFIGRSTPLGILCALFVFLIFPRISNIHIKMPFAVKNRFKTGYTGNISLGDFGEITIDNSKVLQISSSNPKWLLKNSHKLYLKGTSLESFNGVAWSSRKTDLKPYLISKAMPNNNNLNKSSEITLEVITKSMFNDVIFLPEGFYSLTNISDSVGDLFFDQRGTSMHRNDDDPLRYLYKLHLYEKTLTQPTIMQNIKKDFNPKISDDSFSMSSQYHSLLKSVPTSIKNAEYFKSFLSNFKFTNDTPIMDVLISIKKYFHENYEPTLLNDFTVRENFQRFIETDKRGHCEYFASAAVLLLRSIGVPSRIVAGYRGGTYNYLADVVIVRQSDAHAWVEYFVPDVGWYIFDPTPFVIKEGEWKSIAFITNYTNAINYWLSRYLVDYDAKTQRKLYFDTRNTLRQYGSVANFLKSYTFLYIVIGIVMFFLIFTLTRRQRKRRKQYPSYYLDFIKYIEKKGSKIHKEPHETFHHFCHRLLSEGVVDKVLIVNLLDVIEKDLYSRQSASSYLQNKINQFKKLMR